MRVLIVGDKKEIIGGVCNYTRPLFNTFYEMEDVEPFYLSSGGLQKNFHYPLKPYIKKEKHEGKELIYEIVNSDIWMLNYDNIRGDIESIRNDALVDQILDEIKPDVIHVNEMYGLSVQILYQAKAKGIKVFNTVHDYRWLCQHKVMIDYNREICEGPTDIAKCSFCTSRFIGITKDLKKRVAKKNLLPEKVSKFILEIKNGKPSSKSKVLEELDFGDLDYKTIYKQDLQREQDLKDRLAANIQFLNDCDLVIGVSNEVKDILMKFGVESSNILVQHIGSTIAEQTIEHIKKVNPSNITFGFIGGVGYYKGIHQMVEAFLMMPKSYQDKADIKVFGKYSASYYDAIDEKYNIKNIPNKIHFYGRYNPAELVGIFNEIDMMVLPSLCNDTAPQTIFESYSGGIPVIGPEIGGFPDFVIHGENGLLYEKGSIEGLKNSLMRIIDEPELINEFRKKAPKLKTIKNNAKELLNLYEK